VSRILVIDDEAVIRMLMVEILESGGYEVVEAATADRALDLLDTEEFSLVVSDVLPVVLVTGAGTYDTLSQALTRGAAGLVTKPFAHAELLGAVADALERARRSEEELRQRLLTPTLASALANAIEARDSHLHGHCERLASLAVRLAELLGLGPAAIEALRLGAILHDVGKIGIPDSVLLKPGSLDDAEMAIIRTHPQIGDDLLAPLDLLESARPVVRSHHERWDGTGYPDGVAGEQIPLGARIVAIADSIEVMSARQLYRLPRDTAGIVEELGAGRGTQWDPTLTDLALSLIASGELLFDAGGIRLAEPQAAAIAPAAIAVLLVEDDDNADVVAEMLRRSIPGAIVTRAATLGRATELVNGSTWSLAIVDHHLTDGSGLDVVDLFHLRQPTVPVVMLTARGSEKVAVDAFRRGATDYVIKGDGQLSALADRVRDLVIS